MFLGVWGFRANKGINLVRLITNLDHNIYFNPALHTKSANKIKL
jgi:hypothetical protein